MISIQSSIARISFCALSLSLAAASSFAGEVVCKGSYGIPLGDSANEFVFQAVELKAVTAADGSMKGFLTVAGETTEKPAAQETVSLADGTLDPEMLENAKENLAQVPRPQAVAEPKIEGTAKITNIVLGSLEGDLTDIATITLFEDASGKRLAGHGMYAFTPFICE